MMIFVTLVLLEMAAAPSGEPSLSEVWRAIVTAGPVGVLLSVVVYFVNKDRLREVQAREACQKKYEELLESVDADGKVLLAQVLGAMSESRKAIESSSVVVESVKYSLGTIIQFMQGRVDSRRKDNDHH